MTVSTTYSFNDATLSISQNSVGKHTATGEGIQSATVTMTTEHTTHDVAADGVIMVSKIPGENGTVAIATQQTSETHKWLLKWYNYLITAGSDEWATTTLIIRAPNMGDLITATQGSPQKMADRPYQAQGQNVTWTLMFAYITQDSI
jgi:hypothetical protein